MANLETAIRVGTIAHDGQYRRGGEPYITHPLAVMGMLRQAGFPEHVLMKAVLHDVVEDTEWTEYDLIDEGFDEEKVVKGVIILSKKPGQSYEDYEEGILESYEESQIKARDLIHNLASNPKNEKLPVYLSLLTRIALRWGLIYDENR